MGEPEKDETVEVKMSELKGLLVETISGMTIPQIEELKNEMRETERRALFPHGDGGLAETCGKSIIDTRAFSFACSSLAPGQVVNGYDMARSLLASRGPWLHLGPEMQKFAEVIRVRGNVDKMRMKGIDIQEYNAEVLDTITKATGPLTLSDVGALVPVEFLATVIEFATAQSQILPRLWRIPMGSLSLKIPKLAQTAGSYFGGIKLYHPDEAGEKFKTKPGFDTLTFTAKKLIGLIALTDELIADSAINIVNYVTALFVRAFQWETEHEVIQGLGTGNQMGGILADPNIIVVPRQTEGTVVHDDLINLESGLDENFQDLTFISRRATVNTFRKQKDTVGQPVYHDGYSTMFGASVPPSLLGYPLIRTRNAKAMGAHGDVTLADLGFYIWAVRQDMSIDQSKDRYFEFDETAVRFVVRQDGAPGVSEAFAILDTATS